MSETLFGQVWVHTRTGTKVILILQKEQTFVGSRFPRDFPVEAWVLPAARLDPYIGVITMQELANGQWERAEE